MVGLLHGRFYVVGFEENIIKAKNKNEQDAAWYRIKFGNGIKDFPCTCGSSWKVEVAPGKEVEFLATALVLFKEYDCTFDVDMSAGYPKLKLRTFKLVTAATESSKK